MLKAAERGLPCESSAARAESAADALGLLADGAASQLGSAFGAAGAWLRWPCAALRRGRRQWQSIVRRGPAARQYAVRPSKWGNRGAHKRWRAEYAATHPPALTEAAGLRREAHSRAHVWPWIRAGGCTARLLPDPKTGPRRTACTRQTPSAPSRMAYEGALQCRANCQCGRLSCTRSCKQLTSLT